jgi:outer membrane lipoprotein-sorting protein
VVAIGVSATALASAVGSAPTPVPKALPVAVHDALTAPAVQGVSARVTLTDHLVEGASIADGSSGAAGEIAGNPLLSGASGRMWVTKDRVRLELQTEKGDTQIIYDGHTLSMYDAANNTLYRYTPEAAGGSSSGADEGGAGAHEAPSVAKIEEAIAKLRKHVNVSEATPTDVAGQPAYTVRVSPREGGSLIGGAELSFDAVHGTPLRAAVYSSTSSSPVIELAATEVSYGPVDPSVFEFHVPAGAKVHELKASEHHEGSSTAKDTSKGHNTTETTYGHGISSVAVVRTSGSASGSKGSSMEGLPTVKINGATAQELKTELGTILSFERSGVRYIVAGAVPAAAVEAVAKGL